MLNAFFLISFLVLSGRSNQDSEVLSGREHYEVIEVDERNDTLSIVSTAAFVYYPYGKSRSLPVFSKRMKDGLLNRIDSIVFRKSDSKVYVASSNGDSVKYLLIERAGDIAVELVSAKLANSKLKMENGIAIGNSKLSVFETFLIHAAPGLIEKYNFLEIESGLTGMWHIYSFADGRLNGIKIKTDYKSDTWE